MLTAQGGRFRANLKHFKTFDEAAKAYLAGEAPVLAGTRAAIEAALFAAKAPKDVYFGTLDAKLVALNTTTGKVVWRKDIDDFKAGYSDTAAPIIVKGKIITGVSGGEFGVIGRIEARDAGTGEAEATEESVPAP